MKRVAHWLIEGMALVAFATGLAFVVGAVIL